MNTEQIKTFVESLRGIEEDEVVRELEKRLSQMSDAERSNLKNSEARKLLREVRSENPRATARQRAAFFGANVPFNS